MSADGHLYGPARSDALGHVEPSTPPGTYTMAAREMSDDPRSSKQITVVVEAGMFAEVVLMIETGIR